MGAVIFLNSAPGVLPSEVVARQLNTLIPGSRVVDTRVLSDSAAAVFGSASDQRSPLESAFRRALLDAIPAADTTRGTTFIFTSRYLANDEDESAAMDYKVAAVQRESPFISIILRGEPGGSNHDSLLEAEDVEWHDPRRLLIGERKGSLQSPGKPSDVYRFLDDYEMELNVTSIDALEAARRICRYVCAVLREHRA